MEPPSLKLRLRRECGVLGALLLPLVGFYAQEGPPAPTTNLGSSPLQ